MPYTKKTIAEVKDAFDKEYAIFTSGTIIANTVPDTITFNTENTWAMRIKGRKIEVNPDIKVTEAAQAVFDVLAPMLKKQWVGLTDEDIKDIVGRNDPGGIGSYTRDLFKKIEDKLKEKNT